MIFAAIEEVHADLQREATQLAGGLTDAVQRAAVYRHMYRVSGGNHVFPLIAAHGALWSRRYLLAARRLAVALSWQYALNPALRRLQLERLSRFENVLRDINRRVCIDTYVNLHFTARCGVEKEAERFVPEPLLEAMARVHRARRSDKSLSDAEKRLIFEVHFYNEQQHVVGPAINAAVAEFDWPLVRAIALRPPIRFAYFRGAQCLLFRNFADSAERIAQGLRAFQFAAEAGWQHVEGSLARYAALPAEAFTDADDYFNRLTAVIVG
jgi:hypothetical protein